MRYLVTGAAGFIGSKVVEFLLADGHSVVGIDNLNDYYDVRLKDHRLGKILNDSTWLEKSTSTKSSFVGCGRITFGKFVFDLVDIEDSLKLDSIFCEFKFDAVINLAARAGVRYSMENPHVYMSTNAVGTLNLLESMKKHGVKKLVLASTSSLYAGQAMPFCEHLPANTPLSPYAASKKAAELMAYCYHKLYGLDITVLRYFTVFGPAGRPDMSVFRFIKWIDEEKPLHLLGDGLQSRDFTYIDDIAEGTILALCPSGFEIVNLGGGRNPIKLLQVIQWLEKKLGKKAIVEGKPLHSADMKETWADITKARQLLGWSPKVSPEEGLAKSVDWHFKNRDFVSKIRV